MCDVCAKWEIYIYEEVIKIFGLSGKLVKLAEELSKIQVMLDW